MVLPSRMGAGHALKAQAGSPASSRGPERGFAELWAELAFGGTAFPTSRLLAWSNLGIARNAEGSRVCLPLRLGNWQIRSQASKRKSRACRRPVSRRLKSSGRVGASQCNLMLRLAHRLRFRWSVVEAFSRLAVRNGRLSFQRRPHPGPLLSANAVNWNPYSLLRARATFAKIRFLPAERERDNTAREERLRRRLAWQSSLR